MDFLSSLRNCLGWQKLGCGGNVDAAATPDDLDSVAKKKNRCWGLIVGAVRNRLLQQVVAAGQRTSDVGWCYLMNIGDERMVHVAAVRNRSSGVTVANGGNENLVLLILTAAVTSQTRNQTCCGDRRKMTVLK